MTFKGLPEELKKKVIQFNIDHLSSGWFCEEEAIKEAEQAIINSEGTAILELHSSTTISGNTETLTLGNTLDFYEI